MSQVAIQSTAEPEQKVTYNKIITEHFGRDLLHEAPIFDFLRFPRLVSIHRTSASHHLKLVDLPNEVIITIFKCLRLHNCVNLAKSCKFLATLALEARVFVVEFANLRKFSSHSIDEPHPLDLLKMKPDGMTRCLYCDWHGAPETDFFFRHHKMEMVRLGLEPIRGALWTDAFCCLLENLNKPRDATDYDRGMVEILRHRVQRFDELKRKFDEKFA